MGGCRYDRVMEDDHTPTIALPLPWAGAIVMGPGVYVAVGAILAARRAGHGDRQGWQDAAAVVQAELDAALATGARPSVTRQLTRLIAALEAEARAART